MKAPKALHPGALSLMALVAALGAISLGGGAASSAADPCPNEARRAEQGALDLPDCRAYELVTGEARVGQDVRPARAGASGGAVTYYTHSPAPGAASSAFFYLARRGTEGWSRQSVGPQNAAAAQFEGVCEQNVFFSLSLSSNIVEAGWFSPSEPSHCKHPETVVAEEPDLYRNIFVHDVDTDSNQLVNVTPGEATAANAKFQDASDDLSHVVFSEPAQLTPEAPPGNNFYLWSGGVVRLLTLLPDGAPASDGELVEAAGSGSGFAPFTGAMSSDGSRVFFHAGGSLYLRENADQPQSAIGGAGCSEPSRACTIKLDASQGPGADGGGVFWRATPDGATVFFTDVSRLTADSTAEADKPDLYRYDVASRQLTDITAGGDEAADVRGVSGIGKTGSYLYFVANGVLAPGAVPGNCRGPAEPPGRCNLYVLHEGSIAFIATLSRKDDLVWQEDPGETNPIHKTNGLWASVSPSGRFFAFLSHESLTGYDNSDAKYETRDREIFLYDATANGGSGGLSCASCPPGPAQNPFLNLTTAGNYGPKSDSNPSWMANAVLDDGSVFFNTIDALVPRDVNNTQDAYQYRDGVHHLLSSGEFAGQARFLDASPSGSDVFIRTPESLLGQDADNENISIYDVRSGGGFAGPAAPVAPCASESCRGPSASAPIVSLPGTDVARVRSRPRCHRAKHRRHCRGDQKRRRHGERRDGGRGQRRKAQR